MTRDIAEHFTPGSWEFTPDVADVFDGHVRASVPFYDVIQDLVAESADWLLPAHGTLADLGASTGATTHRIAKRHPGRAINAVLYDTEPSMLDKAATTLKNAPIGTIDYAHQRIQTPPLRHTHAHLTVCLFTLQFLPLPDRLAALTNAHTSAATDGALIVAEKIRPPDARWAEIHNDASHDHKERNGIPAHAIRAKAKALRGVLKPATHNTLTRLITNAGWHTPETLFRWHSWIMVGAFATPPDH